MLRSIGGVVAGYLLIFAAIMIGHKATSPKPELPLSQGYLIVSLIYEFPFGILGGYVCGWIAGRSEIKHGIALAVIGISTYVILLIVMYALVGTINEPFWYHPTNTTTLTAAVLLGGWLRARQRTKRAGMAQPPGEMQA